MREILKKLPSALQVKTRAFYCHSALPSSVFKFINIEHQFTMPMITGGFRNHPSPTEYPTYLVSYIPTEVPATSPNRIPHEATSFSVSPSVSSSGLPSISPSVSLSTEPSIYPSDASSTHPTAQPTDTPSNSQSILPSTMPTSNPTTPPTPHGPFQLSHLPSNFPSISSSTDDPTSASSSIILKMEQPPNQYGRKPSRNQPRFPQSLRQPSSANVSSSLTPSGPSNPSLTSKPTRSRGRTPPRYNGHSRPHRGGEDSKKKGSELEKISHVNARKDGGQNDQDAEKESDAGSRSSGPSSFPSLAPSETLSEIPSINSSVYPSMQPSFNQSAKNGTMNELMEGISAGLKNNSTEQPSTLEQAHSTKNTTDVADIVKITSTTSFAPSFSPSTMKPSFQYPPQPPSMVPTKIEPPSVNPSQSPSVVPSVVPTEEPTDVPSVESTLSSTVNSTASLVAEDIIENQIVKGEKNGSTKVSFTLISSSSNGDPPSNSSKSPGENSEQQEGVSVMKENENAAGEQYEEYNVLDMMEFEDEDENIKLIIDLETREPSSPNATLSSSIDMKPLNGGPTKRPISSPSPQGSEVNENISQDAPLKMVFNNGPRNPPSQTPSSSPNDMSNPSHENPTKGSMGEYVPITFFNNEGNGSDQEDSINIEFTSGPRDPPSPNSVPSRDPTTLSFNGPTKVSMGDYETKEVKGIEDMQTLITYHRGKVTMKMGPDVLDDGESQYPTYYPTYFPTALVMERPSEITIFHKDIPVPMSPPPKRVETMSFAAGSEKRGNSSTKVNFNMSFLPSYAQDVNDEADQSVKVHTASTISATSILPDDSGKETPSTVSNAGERGSSSYKVDLYIPSVSSKEYKEKSDDGKNMDQTFSTSTSAFSTLPPDTTPSVVATVEKRESSSSKVNFKLSFDSSGGFGGKDTRDDEENTQTTSTTAASTLMTVNSMPTSNFPTSFPTYLISSTMSPSNGHVVTTRSEPTSLMNSRESPSTLKYSSGDPTSYVHSTPGRPGTSWPTYIPTAQEYFSPQRNSPFAGRPSGGYSNASRPTSSYISRKPPSYSMGTEKPTSGEVLPVVSTGHTTQEPTYFVYPTYYPTTWFPTYIPTSQTPASAQRNSPYVSQPFFGRPTPMNQDGKPPNQAHFTEGPAQAKDLSRSGLSPHPTYIPTYFPSYFATTTNQSSIPTLNFNGSGPHVGNSDILSGKRPISSNGYPVAGSAAPTPFADASFSWTWAPSINGRNEENATGADVDSNALEMVVPTPSEDLSFHWTWAPTHNQDENSTTSEFEDKITQVAPSTMNESYEAAMSSLFEKRFCPGLPFGMEPSVQKENGQVFFAYGVETNSDIEREVEFLQASILDDIASKLLGCSSQTKKSLRDNHPHVFEQYVSSVYYENDGSFYTLIGNCTPTVPEASECAIVESLLYVTVVTGHEDKVISEALALINYKLRVGSYSNEHILRTQYLGPDSKILPSSPIHENNVLSADSSSPVPATFYAAIAIVVLAMLALISFIIISIKVRRVRRLLNANADKNKSLSSTVGDYEDNPVFQHIDDHGEDIRVIFHMTPPRTCAREFRE